MDPFANLLECPGGLGLARFFCCPSCIPIALAGRADAHLLFVGTVASVAAVTAGAHVMDGLSRGKNVLHRLTSISMRGWLDQVYVSVLVVEAYESVH